MIPNAFHCTRFGACRPGGHVKDCESSMGAYVHNFSKFAH